jgi:hypothetical protein
MASNISNIAKLIEKVEQIQQILSAHSLSLKNIIRIPRGRDL